MTLSNFLSLGEDGYIPIQVLKNGDLVYYGAWFGYPVKIGKEKIHKWHIENGVTVITLLS